MQTGTTNVSVGYHALNIDIDVPDIIEKKELGKYTVSATNLSGEKQPAEVSMDVWKLVPNERILRNRLWQTPDQFYLTEAEHKKLFRNEPYKNEGDHQTWEKDKNMYHGVVKTAQSSEVNLAPINGLGQGYYLVELTAKYAFGTEVVQKQYYNLVDASAKVPSYFTTAWFHALKDKYEPGETLQLLVGFFLRFC